jgi:hypothetical protein
MPKWFKQNVNVIVHNIKFLRLFENQVIQDLNNQVTDFLGFETRY